MAQDPWDNVPVVTPPQSRGRSALPVGTVAEGRGGRNNTALLNQGYRPTEDGAWRRDLTPEQLEEAGYIYDPATQEWLKPTAGAEPAPWDSIPLAEPLTSSEAGAERVASERNGLTRADQALYSGMMLGFNDELAGLIAGGGQMASNAVRSLTGQPIEINSGDLRSAVTNRIRREGEEFAQERPVSNFALQALGGGLTGGAGLARGTVRGAIATGTAYGAGYGGGTSEGGFADRLPGAAVGGLVGGATGGVLQGGANTIAQRLGSIASGRVRSATPTPMQERVADFTRVGVDPTLAGVGGPTAQRTAQTLSGNVFTGGPVIESAARIRSQTLGAVDDIASRYGSADGRDAAGRILRRSAESGAQRLRREGGELYAPIDRLQRETASVVSDAGPRQPQTIPLSNAQSAIGDNLSVFQTPALRDWFTRNATDLSELSGVLQSAGGQATLAEARQLRTLVGRMLDDPEVFRSQSQAGLRQMYGALSDDIAAGAQQLGGDDAARALSRADTYYSAARTRADDLLKQFYDVDTDATAYNRLISAANTRGNRSSWQQLRQLRDSVSPEEWGDIGSGVIRTLGQRGDDFSPAQFATAWENMTPQARRVLFGGSGREELFSDLNALARVARVQREGARFYNASESGNVGGNLASAGALGGAVTAAATGNFVPLIAVVGGGGFGNGLSRLLTSPGVARWAARPARDAVQEAERLARRNAAFGQWWNANRQAVVNAVAQNDNSVLAPLSAAAQPEEPLQ